MQELIVDSNKKNGAETSTRCLSARVITGQVHKWVRN